MKNIFILKSGQNNDPCTSGNFLDINYTFKVATVRSILTDTNFYRFLFGVFSFFSKYKLWNSSTLSVSCSLTKNNKAFFLFYSHCLKHQNTSQMDSLALLPGQSPLIPLSSWYIGNVRLSCHRTFSHAEWLPASIFIASGQILCCTLPRIASCMLHSFFLELSAMHWPASDLISIPLFLTKVELLWLWAFLYRPYKYAEGLWFNIIIFMDTGLKLSYLPYST